MKIKNILLPFIITLLLSCPNPVDSKKERSELEIILNNEISDGENSRTILPRYPSGTKYILEFKGNTEIPSIEVSYYINRISLPDGEWDITAKAVNSSGALLGTGAGKVNVPNDSSLSIDLTPAITTSGTGGIDLDFYLTEYLEISSIDAYCVSLSDESKTSLDVSSEKISINELKSGYYVLFIEFKDSSGISYTPYSDVIHVYDNITTNNSIYIYRDHFGKVPNSQSNLKFFDTVDGIRLTWHYNSSNEEGFIIERKTGNGEFVKLTESNNILDKTYIDDSITEGINYSYRVFAKNRIGISDPSNEVSTISSSEPKIIYVKVDGTGNGLSWDDAFGDLQLAINKAATYSRKPQVWVAKGTYYPQSYPDGSTGSSSRYYYFSLKPEVSIFGGFNGTETEFNQRDHINNITILSGDFNKNDIVTGVGEDLVFENRSENAERIFYHGDRLGLKGFESIDGFTIQGAHNTSSYTQGAIQSKNNGFIIKNSIFYANYSDNNGAAIHLDQCDVEIYNTVFDSNKVSYSDYGSAIYMSYGSMSLFNTVFFNNYGHSSGKHGGAIFTTNYVELNILNSIFIVNVAGSAGAVYLGHQSNMDIKNSLFINNLLNNDSTSIYIDDNATVSVYHSIIENYAPNSFKLLDGSFIRNERPQFVNIDNPRGQDGIWLTADDGLRFDNGSFGIDYIYFSEVPSVDITNTPRGDKPDLGPYESLFSDTTAPTILTNVITEPLHESVKISWNQPADKDFRHVNVEVNSNNYTSIYGNNFIVIPGLTNSQEYLFKVSAVDFSGNPSDIVEVNESPQFSTLPDVNNLQLTIAKERLTVTWDDPDFEAFRNIELSLIDSYGSIHKVLLNPKTEFYQKDDLYNENYTVVAKVVDYNDQLSEGITVSATVGSTIFVNDTATGSGDGSSWDNACSDLTRAIKYATAGSDIWVAEGLYIPTENMSNSYNTNPRLNHFQLKSKINLYGGFSGTETSIEQRDYKNNKTILSGDVNQDDVLIGSGESLIIGNNQENLYNVLYVDGSHSYTNYSVIIDGFIITGGNNESGQYYGGAGISSTMRTDIINCVFIGNSSIRPGGAVYLGRINNKHLIKNSIFFNNVSKSNGGAVTVDANVDFVNTLFTGNRSLENGGAFYLSSDKVITLYNSTIVNNYAEISGGAIHLKESDMSINNSIIWNNPSKEGHEILIKTDGVNYDDSVDVLFNRVIMNPINKSCSFYDAVKTPIVDIYPTKLIFKDIYNPIGNDNVWFSDDDGLNLDNSSYGIDLGNPTIAYPEDISLQGGSRTFGKNLDVGAYESLLEDSFAPSEVSSIIQHKINNGLKLFWSDPLDYDFSSIELLWLDNDGISQTLEVEQGVEFVEIANLPENYSITVKTKDIAGNKSQGLIIENSISPVRISLDIPEDETITFDKYNGLTVTISGGLEVNVSEIFDSYNWYLNGIELFDQSHDLKLDCSGLDPGVYRLMCVVEDNDVIFSKNLIFELSNN